MKKQENLSRRSFLKGAGAAGVAALIVPTTTALADETVDFLEVERYIPEVPVSDDDTINRLNRNALDKWKGAVREALEQNAEVCKNQDFGDAASINSKVTGCAKEVKMWDIPCTIAYCAVYDVADDRSIGRVCGIKSYARYFAPDVKPVSASWAKTSSQKSLTALFVTDVTWNPGIYPTRTETIITYAEFSADGFVLSC